MPLYGRVPAGVGTPLVESLTSFVSRLAMARHLKISKIFNYLIRPLVPQDLIEGEDGYSYLDSTNKLAIRHKATGTRLLVRSSRAKGAFGIVGAKLVVCDEPGSFDTIAGRCSSSGRISAGK